MILNNTQANIFKVNGGIADNFANRPAASGSFYIFYSIDTQEIYYDNGAWVLLGSGGGGGVNIYNSDGTLTGNRTLSGANNDLNFADLNIFKTSVGGNDIGFILDFANNFFGIGNIFQDIFFYIDNNFQTIISQYNGNVEGLKLDFIQRTYELGNLDLNFNRTIFIIDDNNQYIKTKNQGNDIGLKLDFANDIYQFGKITNGIEIKLNNNNRDLIFWDTSNGEYLFYADMNNQRVEIGDGGGSFSGSLIAVDNSTKYVALVSGTLYNTTLELDDTNQIIKTSNQANDIGLKLDFANSVYQFGQITGGNITYLNIDDAGRQIYSLFNNLNIGFFISGANNSVLLGNMDATNKLHMTINDNLETAYFSHKLNTYQGLFLNFNNYTFQFGRLTGGNNTYLQINDAVAYPIQLNGTNVLSGTSGGSSGQHLKIKINGIDYKIALLNP